MTKNDNKTKNSTKKSNTKDITNASALKSKEEYVNNLGASAEFTSVD